MKEPFWKSDRFVGIVISLVFLVAWKVGGGVLGSLERNVYDLGVQISNRDPEAHAKIAVVAIDDTSIQNIGRWPWPRDIHANMIRKLTAAGAKTIGSTIFYFEPAADPGLKYISRIDKLLDGSKLDTQTGSELQKILQEARTALDTDALLADAMKQGGRTVLGMQFTQGAPLGNPDAPLPDYVQRFVIPKDKIVPDPSGNGPEVLSTSKVTAPIPALGQPAAGLGHLVVPVDVDGGVRFEPLVVRYYDSYFPSLALMIAARSLNVGVEDMKVNLGDSVELKGLKIKTDVGSNMNTFFYGKRKGDRPPFEVYSFYDVLQDTIPAESFKDKIVLLGSTAYGVGTNLHTPVGDVGGSVLILAHTVASILNQDFFVQPGWAPFAELFVFALVAAYLIGVLPLLRAGPGALVSASTLVLLIAVELVLMKSQAMWLQLVTSAALLAVGHVLLTTKRYLVTEASKLRLDVDSAMSNKQLALKFQQDGQLDMAFDFFRKCPVDDSLLEAVYGLAVDFEAKRKFNKAAAVYQYIAEKNPNFRDIKDKVNRAKQLEETVLLGGASPKAGGTMLLDGSISKPMLGRYEVEKELGKGAMGVVYLGKDPKINRVVAIKTMALSQEFEADELDEVKSRFFREAETAGRLTHPNIVTIYDAGEEHDLAYIAMEFLEGHDLVRYTKPDSLLPLPITMGIVFKAAMALDYAHKMNVVHRDIKPANVMYEPNKKAVKLTDFGIARITDSSRTKTGMVLGTPSYMSPEQLSGKKVDGRSDLFSLGVMLYQLVTGKLPFVGESMATLMYKIANEPHQDIGQIRPELAQQKPCLSAIINKALQKDVNLRYQTGGEMARDIQACAKQVASK